MVFDTTKSPPQWIHIGIVHGGVVCTDFYKNLDFPEIFSRTEDSEVLEFIKNSSVSVPKFLAIRGTY